MFHHLPIIHPLIYILLEISYLTIHFFYNHSNMNHFTIPMSSSCLLHLLIQPPENECTMKMQQHVRRQGSGRRGRRRRCQQCRSTETEQERGVMGITPTTRRPRLNSLAFTLSLPPALKQCMSPSPLYFFVSPLCSPSHIIFLSSSLPLLPLLCTK